MDANHRPTSSPSSPESNFTADSRWSYLGAPIVHHGQTTHPEAADGPEERYSSETVVPHRRASRTTSTTAHRSMAPRRTTSNAVFPPPLASPIAGMPHPAAFLNQGGLTRDGQHFIPHTHLLSTFTPLRNSHAPPGLLQPFHSTPANHRTTHGYQTPTRVGVIGDQRQPQPSPARSSPHSSQTQVPGHCTDYSVRDSSPASSFGVALGNSPTTTGTTDGTSPKSVGPKAFYTPSPEAVLPTVFYPMSNIIATGTSYFPGPQDGLNPAHPYFNDINYLTHTMQQTGLSPESGAVARVQLRFSPHYQGDIFLQANQSEDISDDKNCSLFIVNLPPDLVTHELLAAMHKLGPLGRVFAIHVNGPEPQRNHPGCAAKVVFFKRAVAHAFFKLCSETSGGLVVKGHSARVMWNRIKTSEKPHLANSDASRVLLIAGPPAEVNPLALTNFFREKLEFQVDRIITHNRGTPGVQDATIEYRFGSFRCQAQAAKMALSREKSHIRCFFANDPLEPQAWKPYEYYSFSKKV